MVDPLPHSNPAAPPLPARSSEASPPAVRDHVPGPLTPSGISASFGRRAALVVVFGALAVIAIGSLLTLRQLRPTAAANIAPGSESHLSTLSAEPPADRTAGASRQSVQEILERAGGHQSRGEYAQAATLLNTLCGKNPTDQPVRLAYAQALLGLKRYADAYEQYLAAIALMGPDANPRPGPDGRAIRNVVAAQLHFEAGTCAAQAGKPDRAIEHYSAAQLHDPREARYPLFLGMMQAKVQSESSDGEAIASLLRAAKLNPDLGEAWGTMGEIELRRNQLGLAQQHIAEARRLQPNQLRWRLVEGRALNRQGQPERTLALFSGLTSTARQDRNVLTLLAESFGLLKRPMDAASMYVESAKLAPTDPEVNYQAALWLQRAGELQRAHNFAQSAAALGHPLARELAQQLVHEPPATSPRD